MSEDEHNKASDPNDPNFTPRIASRADPSDTVYRPESHPKSHPEYGKYMYADIIRDFPEMMDYLGQLKLKDTFTCVDLLVLAQALRIRIDYSNDLDTDFALYQPKIAETNKYGVEVVLIVSSHQTTYQEQAWFAAQGMATHILNTAEYVPDFSATKNGMHKWSVARMAKMLLLPIDLAFRAVELSIDLNSKLLERVDGLNHGMSFNSARVDIIYHTAAQLANVPEWLMTERADEIVSA